MKIKRKPVMTSSRRAVKAASGYYEVTNYVDGVPQEIKILDSGVRFRVVRKNDGFKVLAMKQGGHFDYSVETYATPEEASDAMIQDTCTFRNRSLWDVKSSTCTRKTPIKADAADVYENSDDTFEEIFYDIYINENPNGNYYEREEDAIEVANQYAADPQYADDEITVVLEHYKTNARGEIIDYFDDNGAVVWSSNDAIYDSTKINASAELPENYTDLGYDNLDFAVEAAEAAKAAADILASRMQTVKEMRMDNLDPIEWFSGPEEAEAFGKAMYDLATKLDKLSDNYFRIIKKYANF